MAITLGELTLKQLQAQPFGYAETDTTNGLVSRRWSVQGLLTPTEWLDLLSIFDGWQTSRAADPDTMVSLEIGSTVSFSGKAAGLEWSDVACWFTKAPEGEAVGAYVRATFELVDAEQALAVLLRQDEKTRELDDAAKPDLGTVTLGSATLTLLAPMESYQDGPQVQLTASGVHMISGALTATRVRKIQGRTDGDGWVAVCNWYESTVASVPSTGDWYPVSAPSASAEVVINSGVKVTTYVVTIDVVEVK